MRSWTKMPVSTYYQPSTTYQRRTPPFETLLIKLYNRLRTSLINTALQCERSIIRNQRLSVIRKHRWYSTLAISTNLTPVTSLKASSAREHAKKSDINSRKSQLKRDF